MISSAASSRVSTAKGRASSARLTGVERWSSALGSSKPSSSISSRKTNAWSASGEDDKQEKLEPLVPSLFANVPPTVYFFVEGEKGIYNFECFPLEYFGKRIFDPRYFGSWCIVKYNPCTNSLYWSPYIFLKN